MLHYEAHKNLKDVTTGDCNRIVVYNDKNEPISFVIQVGPGTYLTSNIGNDDFYDLIEAFKVDKLKIKK